MPRLMGTAPWPMRFPTDGSYQKAGSTVKLIKKSLVTLCMLVDNFDGFVKRPNSRHSRLRGNDGKMEIPTFYEFINFNRPFFGQIMVDIMNIHKSGHCLSADFIASFAENPLHSSFTL